MKRIYITSPYEHAEAQTLLWAEEEADIDFRLDPARGARCTLSFAAAELKRYLERSLLDTEAYCCSSLSSAKQDYEIELSIRNSTAEAWGGFDCGFTIEVLADGVRIIGNERTGVLYGVYELLRWQGWRWFAPGLTGEVVPELRGKLDLKQIGLHAFDASMDEGRGFDFEAISKESAELLLWMARNRLNVAVYRDSTAALGRKLGMIFKNGGHIFEAILLPDRLLPNGRTLWEAHPEWFGLPANGIRVKEAAQQTQFCVSQTELLDYLGKELIKLLQGQWKHADRIDIWGFDTWGQTCQCADCLSLGNSTDGMLFFIAAMREKTNEAVRQGALNRSVRFVICGYEGTDTINGPSGTMPANLAAARDLVVFYPINRCYAHSIHDSSCETNLNYRAWLKSWISAKPQALKTIIGEYYNVSRFEDLPLLFTQRIAGDLPAYYLDGVRGMTYMHIPQVNWGIRTLTQLIYAQLLWDVNTDVEAFLHDYFTGWYGPFAFDMREAYNDIEQAWTYIADWRAWSNNSVLAHLKAWDGKKPTSTLQTNWHLSTSEKMSISGKQSISLLRRAYDKVSTMHGIEKRRQALTEKPSIKQAANPAEARKYAISQQVEQRIGEARRSLQYGLDTMMLMTAFVDYHEASYHGLEPEMQAAWKVIEQCEELLDSYYVPIDYEWPGAGLISKDGLTRSQLKELISRCRGIRLLEGLEGSGN